MQAVQTPSVPGYDVLARMGAGRSGVVFRVRHEGSGEIQALKVSHPSPRDGVEGIAFKQEFHLHSRLDHPHIVRAIAFGELDAERRWYTMQFVEAVPLTTLFAQHGIRALGEAALGVSLALEYAHGQGALHGDIKPANVLVSVAADGRVIQCLLADFGLARGIGRAGRVQGTPAYLAPEELSGAHADGRSDLYSLGVTLFEALSGKLPFPETSPRELFRAVARGERPAVREAAPSLAPEWAELIESLLARNPEERPPGAGAVAERIAALTGRELAPAGDRSGALLTSALAHVGRDEELQQILGAMHDDAAPRVALVTGGPGVGKTRLAEEIARRAELEGWTVYRADAGSEGADGFSILRSVRREGDVVDLTRPLRPEGEPSPRADREKLVDSLVQDSDGIDAPRLYLFDALEHADLDSVACLDALCARVAGTSSFVLLVACADASRDGPLPQAGDSDALRVEIHPLDAEGIRRHLLAILGGGGVAPPDDDDMDRLATHLAADTGGNPRLIEGALRELAEGGRLTRSGAAWTLAPGPLEEQGLAGRALDRARDTLRRFPPSGRAYLEVASMSGAELDPAILRAAEGFEPESASAFLTEALLRGVLVPSSVQPPRYRLTDPPAARALAGALDEETRREAHFRIAEQLAAIGSDENLAAVGEHLARAGEVEGAHAAFARAAVRNRDAGALREAARCFRRAWELSGPAGARPDLATDWLRALYADGRFEDAVSVADEVLASGERAPGTAPAGVLVWKAVCLGEIGRSEEARLALAAVLEDAAPLGDPALEALARMELGILESRASRGDAAREQLMRARDIAEREGLLEELGKVELHLAVLRWRADDPAGGLGWCARSQEHLTEAGATDLLPAVRGTQAVCHWDLLEARKAAAAHRRAADGYLRQGRRSEAARSLQNLAHVLTEMGQWTDAERVLASAEQLHRTNRAPRQASYFEFARGRLALFRGRLDQAARHADAALSLAGELDDPFVTVGHLGLLGLVQLQMGRHEECTQTAESTLGIAREKGYRWGVSESLYLLGRATHRAGDRDRAIRLLDEGRMVAEDACQPVVLFRILLASAELLAERGDLQSAKELMTESRALQERSESVFWKARVHLAEGRVCRIAGRNDLAAQELTRAYETFARLGAERYRAETLLEQSRVHLAFGNRPAAETAARHARTTFEGLGLAVPGPPLPEGRGRDEESLVTVRRILETAAAVSRDITTLQSVDEVLQRILDVAITYLGTERGVVALADPETGELSVKLARNIDRESLGDSLEISRSALASVRRDGEMVHTGDALADPHLGIHESVRRERIRSLVSLPIRWGEEMLGAVYMDHRTLTDLFGPEERLFLRFIADMAAIGIRNARELEIKEEAVRNLRGELEEDELVFPGTVVGRGARMRDVFRRGQKAARAGKVILLTGPSGAGKDHLARILHRASGPSGEFVDCPLPTLPETLIESELFGVAPGAATLVEARDGLAQAARGGTLFLNEVGDLPLALQPKLLHFLEHREFRKVGSAGPVQLEALIVCATNADLESRVAEGTFRQDLFYRMSECVLELPSLRERQEDIPDLADLFLREFERRSGRPRCVIHTRALDLLMRCPWEGNVRELRACLSRAADEATRGMIEPEHLDSPSLRRMESGAPAADGGVRDEIHLVEVRRIHEAMARSGGIITRAAAVMGLKEGALRRRISKYGLQHLVLHRRSP